jgi:hypothetical protein
MFASGVPTAEKPTAKKFFLMSHRQRLNANAQNSGPASSESTHDQAPMHSDPWANYKSYLSRTSILIPIPPVLYKPLPEVIKRTVLLDFAMYQFGKEDEKLALEEEGKKGQDGQ